jgi:hypothetical protein
VEAKNLGRSERRILAALNQGYESFYGEPAYYNFRHLMQATNLSHRQVVRAVRALKGRNLAVFGRGLFNDEGEVAGAGYAITDHGHTLIEIAEGKINDRRNTSR